MDERVLAPGCLYASLTGSTGTGERKGRSGFGHAAQLQWVAPSQHVRHSDARFRLQCAGLRRARGDDSAGLPRRPQEKIAEFVSAYVTLYERERKVRRRR
jgi:hypothetical protein